VSGPHCLDMSETGDSRPEPSVGGERFDDGGETDPATGDADPRVLAGSVVIVALVAGPILSLDVGPGTLVFGVATAGPTGGLVAGALVTALPDVEVNRATATEAAVGGGATALAVGLAGLVLLALDGLFVSDSRLVSTGVDLLTGSGGAAAGAWGVVEVVRVARQRSADSRTPFASE